MTDPDDRVSLKPCPFCGSAARSYSRDNRPVGFAQNEIDHWIDCTADHCLPHHGMAESAEEAARYWNTRALSPDDAVTEAMIEAGREASGYDQMAGFEYVKIYLAMRSAALTSGDD